jgi:hypothetical protein
VELILYDGYIHKDSFLIQSAVQCRHPMSHFLTNLSLIRVKQILTVIYPKIMLPRHKHVTQLSAMPKLRMHGVLLQLPYMFPWRGPFLETPYGVRIITF